MSTYANIKLILKMDKIEEVHDLYLTADGYKDFVLGIFDEIVENCKTVKEAGYEALNTFDQGIVDFPSNNFEITIYERENRKLGFKANVNRIFVLIKDRKVFDYLEDNRSFSEVSERTETTLAVIDDSMVKEMTKKI